MNERGPSRRLRFEEAERVTSGQLGPKSTHGPSPPDKRKQCLQFKDRETPSGSLLAEDSAVSTLSIDDTPATSGQVDLKLKKDGKLRQDKEKVKYSQRLRHDGEKTPPVDEGVVPGETHKTDKKAADQNKRLKKSKFRMERTEEQLGVAREKLVLQKPLKSPGPIRQLGRAAKFEAWVYVHGKIRQVEHENVGTEAAHKTELVVETAARSTGSLIKHHMHTQPTRRVRKLEKQDVSRKADYDYRKLMQEQPELKKNAVSRSLQKHKIKRQYAKQAREAAKQSKAAAKEAAKVFRAAASFIKRNPKLLIIILIIVMVILLLQSCMASMLAIGNGLLGAIGSTSYLAEDADIDEAELRYTEWETDLQLEINHVETDYPDYDEYRYDVQDISHNPYELMAFLTAVYDDFTYAGIQAILQQVFNEQYSLSFVEEIEVRYRTEPHTDTRLDDYGNPQSTTYDIEVPYDYYILNINLIARSFTEIIFPRMTAEQLERYNIYMTTKGNRQYLQSPFGDLNWLPYVSSYYGYRVHPISGEKNYHKGADIALPSGTEVLAGHEGTVTFAGSSGDYGFVVVLDNGEGLVSKYGHCSNLLVTNGQTVIAGQSIAKVGNTGNSTGAHLHLEITKEGRYLNPLYYATTNDYLAGPTYSNDPGGAMGDGSFAALIAEAEKHLGKPYVFGASGPNSFDCSSFVCWVFTHSGVYNLPRTTAQGIYNQCTPISPEEAQPGDLIFFTGTYSTPNACSHVGIYVGGGMMIHAGNPVQYTSFNTPYWQSHFYSFGRLQ